MTSKGLTSALLLASMFAATSGCLQQNALTQGYRTTQPGQPGQALIKTRNQMSDGGSIRRDVDDVQKVGKGHAVRDSVESMTGGPQQPCG